MSHEVTQRLSVAVDSLHGLRTMTMTEGDSGIGVGLRTYAPYPLLRAAIENACTVAWLLSPSDEATRVTRRFQLWAKSHDARNDVELLMKANEDKMHRVPDPVGWSRDLGWIERMRQYGVPDVDKTLKDPKRAATTTRVVDSGAKALAQGARDYKGHHYSLAWRGLSGASHGDLWALMSLPDREVMGEPDPVTDRVGTSVFMTARTMALWTSLTTTAVTRAIGMYDRHRLVLTDHAQPSHPIASTS